MTSPDTETNTPEPIQDTTAPVTQKVAEAVSETTGQEVTTTTAAEAVVSETVVADATVTDAAAAEAYEEPQTVVFSLVGFFLAYIPLIGVIVNGIAVAKAGKEGFDLFVARWGLVLAILSTLGASILVGAGFWWGLETGRGGM